MIATQLRPGADPTAVLGRRIGAYAIDLLLVLLVVLPIGVWQFMAEAEVVTDGSVRCQALDETDPSNSGSTAIDSTFCFQSGDQVRYMTESQAEQFSFLIWGTVVTVQALNLIVLQGLTGGTVGKLLVGLRVVRMQSGDRAGFGWIVLRSLLLMVDAFCFFLPGIVLVASTRGHRRIGDMAAGTLVVGREHVGHGPISVPELDTPAAMTTWPAPPPPGAPPNRPPGWAPPVAPPEHPDDAIPTSGADDPGSARPAGEDPSTPSGDGPTWDDARNTYIQYDRELAEWMEWDDGRRTWVPISR